MRQFSGHTDAQGGGAEQARGPEVAPQAGRWQSGQDTELGREWGGGKETGKRDREKGERGQEQQADNPELKSPECGQSSKQKGE